MKKENPRLGKIKDSEFEIRIKSNSKVQAKPYPIPLTLHDPLMMELEDLQKKGIIRDSAGEFNSPCFPVKKKNVRLRLIIDYRKLNSVTRKETYPLPNSFNQLMTLKDSNWFDTIDINMDYYQVPIKESSNNYTPFVVADR